MTNEKEVIHHPFHGHSQTTITCIIKRLDILNKKIQLKKNPTIRNTTSTTKNIYTSTESTREMFHI